MTMRTERTPRGIRYTVEQEGRLLFDRFVKFGNDRRHRAGGAAFTEAARAQEAAAGLNEKGKQCQQT